MDRKAIIHSLVLMGACHFVLTSSKKGGKARSLAKAYIILELLVKEKRPQCQMQTMTKLWMGDGCGTLHVSKAKQQRQRP